MATKQNNNLYPIGSVWRKWDLHFHTPSSNYEDKSITDEEIISNLTSKGIEAVAITDHHLIDINRIKNLKKIAGSKIVFFPGIELCSDSRGSEPIHFIGIFPEDCDIEYIWKEIESKADIAKQRKEGKKDDEIYCNLKESSKLIRDLKGIVSIHAGRKSNSIEKITNSLPVNMAEKKDLVEYIDIFELGQEKDQEDYKNIVFPKIGKSYPMIICSDNHNAKNYKLKQYCWIKADPTFEGLKQIIYEHEERIYIGEEPEILRRVRENKTKFIKALKINQVQEYNEEKGIWFKNIEIPLNPGFVSIIGNRGNGKSALTDIISLCGNSYLYKDFSFLTEDKFLKNGLAGNFEAELIWESGGDAVRKNLSDSIDPDSPERIRYLPQNFFERLADNLELYEFEDTLEKVVFSYIPEEKKLGKNSFEELIRHKQQIVEKDIVNIREEIKKLNQTIIDRETKIHPEYKEQIKQKLALKKKELEEHKKIKPQEVSNPKDDKNLSKELINKQKQLQSTDHDINKIEDQIKEARDKLKAINIQIQDLKAIRDEILEFKREVEAYIKNNTEKLEKYGLDLNEILILKIDINKIGSKIKEKENEQKELESKLMTEDEIKNIDKSLQQNVLAVNLKVKLKKLKDNIEKIKNQLTEPQRKYQLYLEELKKWENKKKEIEGDENIPNSLKWLEKELKYIEDQLESDIINLRDHHLNLTNQIYKKKKEVVDIYMEFKDTADKKILEFQDILGEYKITIDASLEIKSSFYEDFLKFINQNRRGSFYGEDEGKTMLEKIIKTEDINTETGVRILLSEIVDYLEIDKREEYKNKEEKRYIKDQIIRGDKWLDFYDYVFSLDYIEPVYKLKFGNKELAQLSPGEKGALLIVFYLLLDKEDIPLVIDQPEQNLDNESVYKILRHFIKYTKKERQVIIVTHNPNLAIVGDAEQIIFVKMDKEKQNKFSYESGAIENPKINKHASDILEGTLKAFDIRRLKYLRV